MGKKRELMTVEQCKAQVEEEIPYEVGKGTQCVQRRSRRLKELFAHDRQERNDGSAHATFLEKRARHASTMSAVKTESASTSSATASKPAPRSKSAREACTK